MTILCCLFTTLLLLVAIALLALKPTGRKRAATAKQATVHFAHRGLHTGDGHVPENSLAAFRLAAEAGTAVEFDVQLTADGQVVVFHDDTLARLCGDQRRIDALTYDELQQFTLLNSDQRIPLLSQVLDILDGVPILCELKTMRNFTDTRICDAVWPLLAAYKGTVWIESFNPLLVRWFKVHQPQLMRGILSMRFNRDTKEVSCLQGKLLTALFTNFFTKPDFIAYRLADRKELAFRLCCALYHPLTLAWTVLSRDEESEAIQGGFDGVIFERYSPISPQKK